MITLCCHWGLSIQLLVLPITAFGVSFMTRLGARGITSRTWRSNQNTRLGSRCHVNSHRSPSVCNIISNTPNAFSLSMFIIVENDEGCFIQIYVVSTRWIMWNPVVAPVSTHIASPSLLSKLLLFVTPPISSVWSRVWFGCLRLMSDSSTIIHCGKRQRNIFYHNINYHTLSNPAPHPNNLWKYFPVLQPVCGAFANFTWFVALSFDKFGLVQLIISELS